MRRIVKQGEPPELATFRETTPDAHYDGIPGPVKQRIREFLVREQGWLCAYCLSRINDTFSAMRVEHWLSQSEHPDEDMAWENMLGVCPGREDVPGSAEHCDRSRGNVPLHVHPARIPPDVESILTYSDTGFIRCDDPLIQGDIDGILNLNCALLRGRRKRRLAGFIAAVAPKHGKRWPRAKLEKQLQVWYDVSPDGKYREDHMIVVYWIRRRLARN